MHKKKKLILISVLSLYACAGFSQTGTAGAVRPAAASAKEHERAQRAYQRGQKALDERQWEKAIAAFDEVSKNTSSAEGALYWKAYALNKSGRRAEALTAIAELQNSFPSSRWINDAKALEVEVRQAAGQPVPPEAETNEDLKLMAINSLLSSDPERAVPLLEKVVAGSNPPKIKERALFILSQSDSPRAKQILLDAARGKLNPDLQSKAVQYLGMFNGKANRQILAELYATSGDEIKRQVLRSFMIAGDGERLMAVVKQEKNPELRKDAIRQLGLLSSQLSSALQAQLSELYRTDPSNDVRKEILRSFFLGGQGDKVTELARNEKDPELRREAIRTLGLMKGTAPSLVAIYTGESDTGVRKSVINALFLQSNAAALVNIARKESDPELKREAVRRLSMMHSKEAADYMVELLNK